MTTTVQAVYTGGVPRPVRPLGLTEGETVELTITSTTPNGPPLRPPTAEEQEYARRLQAAHSLEEMLAVMATAPPLPEGYDLCEALNANRQATGERPLYPERPAGDS